MSDLSDIAGDAAPRHSSLPRRMIGYTATVARVALGGLLAVPVGTITWFSAYDDYEERNERYMDRLMKMPDSYFGTAENIRFDPLAPTPPHWRDHVVWAYETIR